MLAESFYFYEHLPDAIKFRGNNPCTINGLKTGLKRRNTKKEPHKRKALNRLGKT